MTRARTAVAIAGLIVAISASPSAHRLDEYLQAARVSLERTQVMLEMDLAPGASVADDIIALIDRDSDERLSPLEVRAYAERVLEDVVVDLDGRPVTLTLQHVEAASTDEMRHGMGALQLRAVGDVQSAPLWRRQRRLHFQNNHHTASSVYLVNALMPGDNGITVLAQTRNANQREARLDYIVAPRWPRYAYWPVIAGVIFFFARRRIRSIDQ